MEFILHIPSESFSPKNLPPKSVLDLLEKNKDSIPGALVCAWDDPSNLEISYVGNNTIVLPNNEEAIRQSLVHVKESKVAVLSRIGENLSDDLVTLFVLLHEYKHLKQDGAGRWKKEEGGGKVRLPDTVVQALENEADEYAIEVIKSKSNI